MKILHARHGTHVLFQAQSTESPRNMVKASSRRTHINQAFGDSASYHSDSSWTSEEPMDQVRAVHDLKEDDVFAKKYAHLTRSIVVSSNVDCLTATS